MQYIALAVAGLDDECSESRYVGRSIAMTKALGRVASMAYDVQKSKSVNRLTFRMALMHAGPDLTAFLKVTSAR